MSPHLALALAVTAHAQQAPAEATRDLDDVVSVVREQGHAYVFPLSQCDNLKARIKDPLGPDAQKRDFFVVRLRNESDQMCMYRGLALTGLLAGSYQPSRQAPESQGFFVPPGETTELRIKPTDGESYKAAIELQIAPGKGIVLLEGLSATDLLQADR